MIRTEEPKARGCVWTRYRDLPGDVQMVFFDVMPIQALYDQVAFDGFLSLFATAVGLEDYRSSILFWPLGHLDVYIDVFATISV